MPCDIALILAAGKGKRLKPITDTIPKPLIQVGKYRLIEYHIFNLAKAGIKTIYINRAHLRKQFDYLLVPGAFTGIELIYLDEPDGALETAGAIINAFNQIDSERLLVVNGDIWTTYNFNNIIELPSNINDSSHVILTLNPDHNIKGDFSIHNNRLRRLAENQSTYTFTGIGIYRRQLFENKDIEYKKLAPILNQQIELDQISASVHDGEWMDVGTVERLNLLRSKLDNSSL